MPSEREEKISGIGSRNQRLSYTKIYQREDERRRKNNNLEAGNNNKGGEREERTEKGEKVRYKSVVISPLTLIKSQLIWFLLCCKKPASAYNAILALLFYRANDAEFLVFVASTILLNTSNWNPKSIKIRSNQYFIQHVESFIKIPRLFLVSEEVLYIVL